MRRLSSRRAELANHYGRRPYPDNLQPQIRTPATALVRSESAFSTTRTAYRDQKLITLGDRLPSADRRRTRAVAPYQGWFIVDGRRRAGGRPPGP